MLGGSLCPWCRYYNANDAASCGRCHQRLPPRSLAGPIAALLGVELWATKLLVALNCLVFAAQLAMTSSIGGQFIGTMPPSVLLRFGALSNGLEWVEPWRLLSACFVHIGALHLAFNMMSLVQLGRVGEQAVAGPRFLVAYVASGIVGFAVSGVWYAVGEHGAPYITAGASGAIFGVTGLLIAMMARRGDARWKDILVQQLIYSFVMWKALNTNQAAHLGGLAVGGAFGAVFARETRPWRISIFVNAAAAVALLVTVASLALPHFSPRWRPMYERDLERKRLRDYVERPVPEPVPGRWQPVD